MPGRPWPIGPLAIPVHGRVGEAAAFGGAEGIRSLEQE